MARNDNVETLTWHECEELVRFFLFHMGPPLRGQLMAERPTLYAKLFPSAKTAVIEHVVAAVAAVGE